MGATRRGSIELQGEGNASVTGGECLRPHDLASWDAEISGSCRQADREPPPSRRRYGRRKFLVVEREFSGVSCH